MIRDVGCGKVKYDSRKKAKQHLRRTRDEHRSRNLRAYLCLVCGFWHLTSQSTERLTYFRDRRNRI